MIKIDENFRLEPDSFCWRLVKEVNTGEINDKTGKEIISADMWYCGTIKDALRRYSIEAAKRASTYDELMKTLNKIEETIETIKFTHEEFI